MKAVLIATLMFVICLTFASPGLSTDIDAHPDRIVIVGAPMDDHTDIEHMVEGFERIYAAKEFYESEGSEVWIEDPAYGIKDHILGKLASDLKDVIGRCAFIHGHEPGIKEVAPDDNTFVDIGFFSKAIVLVTEIDENIGKTMENIRGSVISIYMHAEDTAMINISPVGGERKDSGQEEDEASDDPEIEEEDDDDNTIMIQRSTISTHLIDSAVPSAPSTAVALHGTIF
ncbi:MAG: hypothetical protein ACI38Y_07525 [Candidatus Methanomethylophilaceae archaeon]